MTETTEKYQIGLALGSGAARGLAHIGVLKVFEEEKIPIDLITGTSMGAFIGALYAAGVSVEQMERAALEIDWLRLTRLIDPVLPTSGLMDGKKLVSFMAELLPARTFEELSVPLAVTATDIKTGEAIIIKQGDLLEALRASLAFPGIFSPVRFGSRILVDGGLCNPVPVDVARQLGAERIIGICTIPEVAKQVPETYIPLDRNRSTRNLSWRELFNARGIEQTLSRLIGEVDESPEAAAERSGKMPNIFRVFAQSVAIMENEINDLRLKQNHHDLIIRPSLDEITLLEFHRAAEIIAAGDAATREALPRLCRLLDSD